jgi:hypothetical protein
MDNVFYAFFGAFAGAMAVVIVMQFSETPEERHARMMQELQYILPVLKAMKGGE